MHHKSINDLNDRKGKGLEEEGVLQLIHRLQEKKPLPLFKEVVSERESECLAPWHTLFIPGIPERACSRSDPGLEEKLHIYTQTNVKRKGKTGMKETICFRISCKKSEAWRLNRN